MGFIECKRARENECATPYCAAFPVAFKCKKDKEYAAFPTGVYKAYTSKGKRMCDTVLRRISRRLQMQARQGV